MSSEGTAKNIATKDEVVPEQGLEEATKNIRLESDLDMVESASEQEDLMTKIKVEAENFKNLIKSTQYETKRFFPENNNVAESTLAKKVDGLSISAQNHGSKSTNVMQGNTSLNNLLVYDSDSSSSYDDNDSTDSVDSDPDSTADDDDDDVDDDEPVAETNKGAIKKTDLKKNKDEVPKVMGELSLDELPPVPDLSTLSLNVDKEEFTHMGHIHGIVDRIVTVEALPNLPAYDLDTPLFFGDAKRPLGQVFDVLGQISAPMYVVRFNSPKDISEVKLEKGMKVYSAPKNDMTHYVFVKELLKYKGSDASWVGDLETPQEMQEFSDDEDEHRGKTNEPSLEEQSTRKRPHSSVERHKRFERTMNKCNMLNTRVNRLIDARNNVLRQTMDIKNAANVVFDPSKPPPGFPDCNRPPVNLPYQRAPVPYLPNHYSPNVPSQYAQNLPAPGTWEVNIPNNKPGNWAAHPPNNRLPSPYSFPYYMQPTQGQGEPDKDASWSGWGASPAAGVWGPQDPNSLPGNSIWGAPPAMGSNPAHNAWSGIPNTFVVPQNTFPIPQNTFSNIAQNDPAHRKNT